MRVDFNDDYVNKMIGDIEKHIELGDYDLAHKIEDILYFEFIKYVKRIGACGLSTLAYKVLQTRKLDIVRKVRMCLLKIPEKRLTRRAKTCKMC